MLRSNVGLAEPVCILRLAGAHRITIHVPASREAWLAPSGGDASRLEHDQSVLTPAHEAKPTFGSPGETSTTASVVIATYVSQSVSQTQIAELVAALAAARPRGTSRDGGLRGARCGAGAARGVTAKFERDLGSQNFNKSLRQACPDA